MIIRKLGVGGAVLVLWVALLGALALPALAAQEKPELTVEDTTAVVAVPSTEALLRGVLNPAGAGEAGTYRFLYNASSTGVCTGGSETAEGLSPVGKREEPAEAITGLAPGTEYAVCLRVENNAETESSTSVPVTFTTALPPEAPETLSPAKSITATTAVLEGVLNPHVNTKDGWYFYYDPYEANCPYIGTALEPEVTGEAVKVHTEATGLEPHTKYTFCLVAVNAASEQTLSSNEASFETLAAPPTVLGESSSSVTASTARIEGTVNPSNEATECHFEYGVASVSEHIVPCEQPSLMGIEPVGVGLNVAGLTQHTTYHYRIIAKNGTGTDQGEEEAFTTGTPEVPETKAATEIGSFTAKLHGVLSPNHAGEAGTYEFVYRESFGGDGNAGCQGEKEAVTGALAANGVASEPVTVEAAGLLPGATYIVCLRATNGAGEQALGNPVSFTTPAVAPMVSGEFVSEVSSGSATLNGLVNPGGANTTYRFEYGRTASYGETLSGDAGSGPEPVTVKAHPQDLAPGVLYHYRLVVSNEIDNEVAGADHTFTTQPLPATFTLPDGREWEMVSPPNKNGAEVSNLRLMHGGIVQAAENGDAITYMTSFPITAAARGNPLDPQAISKRGPDGWVSEDIATPHNGASASEFEGGTPRTARLEEYFAFSPDLSLAYVEPEARTPLVPGQPAPEEVESRYLGGYVRDMATGTYSLTKLTPEEWHGEQVAREVSPPSCDANSSPAKGVGVDAVSSDGCYVYFNSEADLAPGASGPDPLYVSYYDGSSWSTTFISSLSGTGAPEWEGNFVELSPNGRYVAFMSELSLTGYDNRDASAGELDEEVYLYDATKNRLVCASCNPTGERPDGQFDPGAGTFLPVLTGGRLLVDRTAAWQGHWLAGILPGWSSISSRESGRIHQARYVTDSGQLFFDSPDRLVAQDVNGLENVYEYEPEGFGGCSGAVGCVSLISSGTSNRESAFVDASVNGSDAFFMTNSRLMPQDVDDSLDIYDAHVCSASVPCQAPLVAPPACETSDACKVPPSPQSSAFGEPATWTFSGAGNFTGASAGTKTGVKPRGKITKCPKGLRMDKHGRCVKQKHKKKAKKSSRGSN